MAFSCSKRSLTQYKILSHPTFTKDRLAIINLLAGSAFGSDLASKAYWTKKFTEDTTFDREIKQNKGRIEILKIINTPEQNAAIKAGMTH